MPPPSPIPPLIPHDWFDGFFTDPVNQKIAKKAALVSAAVAAAFAVPKGSTTAPKVVHFLTGIEVVPRVGIKVKPLFITWLAPEPFGVVPPEWWDNKPYTGDLKFQARKLGLYGGRDVNQQIRDQWDQEHRLETRTEQIQTIIHYTRSPELLAAAIGHAERVPDPTAAVFAFAFRKELVRRGVDVAALDAVLAPKLETHVQQLIAAEVAGLQEAQHIDALFAANPADP